MKTLLTCTVNGEEHTVLADTRDTLLDLLRDRLGLTGTKEGCGNGNCGTCTVLMDGAPVNACLVLALEVPGREHHDDRRAVRAAARCIRCSRRWSSMAARNAASARRASCSPPRRCSTQNPRPSEARDPPRHRRQPVPLHRLRQDRRGDRGGGARSGEAEPMTRCGRRTLRRRSRSIGKRLPRVDARERVTGEAVYPADLALPGMVHAKLLRSPHAHARIRAHRHHARGQPCRACLRW